MAKRKIEWSNYAEEQLASVLEFYIQQNGNANYSLKLIDEIEDLLNTLSSSELIGRLTSNKFTRVIPMDVYLIFYEVTQEKIHIVSFWDNRQNPKNRKIK